MRLLKIIGVIFLIYFIRRFIQMYRVMTQIQQQQDELRRRDTDFREAPRNAKADDAIEADFKVVDR